MDVTGIINLALPWIIIYMIVQAFLAPFLPKGGLKQVGDMMPQPDRKDNVEEVPRDHLERAIRHVISAAKINGRGHIREVVISGDEETPEVRLKRVVGCVFSGYSTFVVFRRFFNWRARVLVFPQSEARDFHSRTMVVRGRGVHCTRGLFFLLPSKHTDWYDTPEGYYDHLWVHVFKPILSMQIALDLGDAVSSETIKGSIGHMREHTLVERDQMPVEGALSHKVEVRR